MKKIQKWIKQYRGAAVLLGLGVLTLIIYGSFAAYTSFNSVKRVVSTERRSDTMFGSNYLTLLNLTDNNYSIRRITLSEEDDKNTFTVKYATMPGEMNLFIILRISRIQYRQI